MASNYSYLTIHITGAWKIFILACKVQVHWMQKYPPQSWQYTGESSLEHIQHSMPWMGWLLDSMQETSIPLCNSAHAWADFSSLVSWLLCVWHFDTWVDSLLWSSIASNCVLELLSSSIILSVSETSLALMAATGGRVEFTIGTDTLCIFSRLALADDVITFNSTESGFLFFLWWNMMCLENRKSSI